MQMPMNLVVLRGDRWAWVAARAEGKVGCGGGVLPMVSSEERILAGLAISPEGVLAISPTT